MTARRRPESWLAWIRQPLEISGIPNLLVLGSVKCAFTVGGYRVYYTRRGILVYVLLVGGDKSTQRAHIRRAKAMAKALED